MTALIHPKSAPGFQAQDLDGEIVLLNPENNTILHINQTGALVWQLCNGERPLSEIINLLSTIYPEARDEIAADVPQVIAQLAAHGALYIE